MNFISFFKQNNDRDIAARVKAATRITLDNASREKMRGFLSEYARMRPIRSDHTMPNTSNNRLFTSLTAHIHPMPVIAAILVIAVSSGTVAASETALPGDLLYPIKVHVTEEARAALAVTPKARADWAVERAERRLEEAATLDLAGELDDAARAEIDSNLDEHVRVAGEDRQQLEDENDVDAADVDTNIRAVLLARENILGGVRPMPDAKAATKTEPEREVSLTISTGVAPGAQSNNEVRGGGDRPETIARGNRTAAKARIEATKKFLNRSGKRVDLETNARVQEQLKVASDALSSGEESVKLGKESEAFDDFSKALKATIETQDFVSEYLDSDKSSQNDTRRGERSGSSNESKDPSVNTDESNSGKSPENDD